MVMYNKDERKKVKKWLGVVSSGICFYHWVSKGIYCHIGTNRRMEMNRIFYDLGFGNWIVRKQRSQCGQVFVHLLSRPEFYVLRLLLLSLVVELPMEHHSMMILNLCTC